MKRLIFNVAILLIVSSKLMAQQVLPYKYSLSDDYLMNPAYVGTNDYYSILFGVDQRFSGISLSPQTAFISIHSKVGTGILFEKDGKINKFFSKFGSSSFGLQFFQFDFGPQYETNIGLTYGHHVKLSPNRNTKTPRRLMLAMTPRYQVQGFRTAALLTAMAADGVSSIFPDPHIPIDNNSNLRSHMFNLDVAALYQTVHVDLGLSALNIVATKNNYEVENDGFVVPNEMFNIFDTIYSPTLAVNAKLKFLNLFKEENYSLQFVPKFVGMYAYKRQTMEVFVDLALENTFSKTIAGHRRKDFLVGNIGVNINYDNRHKPVTYMTPYISIDYNNYVITYSYSYTLNSDIMNVIWGANQITFAIKLGNDKVVSGNRSSGQWSR